MASSQVKALSLLSPLPASGSDGRGAWFARMLFPEGGVVWTLPYLYVSSLQSSIQLTYSSLSTSLECLIAWLLSHYTMMGGRLKPFRDWS